MGGRCGCAARAQPGHDRPPGGLWEAGDGLPWVSSMSGGRCGSQLNRLQQSTPAGLGSTALQMASLSASRQWHVTCVPQQKLGAYPAVQLLLLHLFGTHARQGSTVCLNPAAGRGAVGHYCAPHNAACPAGPPGGAAGGRPPAGEQRHAAGTPRRSAAGRLTCCAAMTACGHAALHSRLACLPSQIQKQLLRSLQQQAGHAWQCGASPRWLRLPLHLKVTKAVPGSQRSAHHTHGAGRMHMQSRHPRGMKPPPLLPAGDQAETVLMRVTRASGIAGLAGIMSAVWDLSREACSCMLVHSCFPLLASSMPAALWHAL